MGKEEALTYHLDGQKYRTDVARAELGWTKLDISAEAQAARTEAMEGGGSVGRQANTVAAVESGRDLEVTDDNVINYS